MIKRSIAIAIVFVFATCCVRAQVDLLPLDHPATVALVRMYEFGAVREFPREHLPISRQLAYRLLQEALFDSTVPESMREQARYHLIEIGADVIRRGRAVVIPIADDDRSILDDPTANWPLAILEARDSTYGARIVVEPLTEAEARADPDSGTTAFLGTWGLSIRGTILDHFGFAARVSNGSVAGDSALAARDPRIQRSGAFGIAGLGRDIDLARAHMRLDYDAVAIEISRELLQLGGGGRQSLFVGSLLASEYDALRMSARIGRITFTHLHGSLMPDVGKDVRGVYTDIPSKFIAAHLLSIGPFGGGNCAPAARPSRRNREPNRSRLASARDQRRRTRKCIACGPPPRWNA
ncbi:MAG: hypothetical protein H7X80_03465, partial [bacterium]|nr:hypothetical protein [Candidatus Kapabacteria bacterium]